MSRLVTTKQNHGDPREEPGRNQGRTREEPGDGRQPPNSKATRKATPGSPRLTQATLARSHFTPKAFKDQLQGIMSDPDRPQTDSDRPKNTQTDTKTLRQTQMNPDKPRQTQTDPKKTHTDPDNLRQTWTDQKRPRQTQANQHISRSSKINSHKLQQNLRITKNITELFNN